MRAQPRLALISLLPALLFVAAAVSSAPAQVHGIPPSVTSFGFGGNFSPTPGIPASVTSVGPFGYGGNCCFGTFGPFGPFGSPFISPSHWPRFNGRDGHHHHHEFPAGNMMPIYIPYAYPYPVPYGGYDVADDENADVDYTYSRGVPTVYDRGPWYRDAPATRQTPSEAPVAAKEDGPTVSGPPATVTPQPATVLVYKDGRKVEVQNYAIVGETLFDFADNRYHKILLAELDLPATQKANDERGVDFQVPVQKLQSK